MKTTLSILAATLTLAACGSDEDVLDKYPPGQHACALGNWLTVDPYGRWSINIEGTRTVLFSGTKLNLAENARKVCGLR